MNNDPLLADSGRSARTSDSRAANVRFRPKADVTVDREMKMKSVARWADGTEVVERDGRFFIRYDAGSHQVTWREDELSAGDLDVVRLNPEGVGIALRAIQKRLLAAGVDPYRANWTPTR